MQAAATVARQIAADCYCATARTAAWCRSAHSRYMAAHSTIVRSTAAPVPSVGGVRVGHGARRLAGSWGGAGGGCNDAQAVSIQAHVTIHRLFHHTLHLLDEHAALLLQAGAHGFMAGGGRVGAASKPRRARPQRRWTSGGAGTAAAAAAAVAAAAVAAAPTIAAGTSR